MMQNSSFLDSLKIQCRVIVALLLREAITRFGRHNIGFMWLFVEPMLFTMGVTSLWIITKGVHGFRLPIVAFAVTGYSSVLLWRNSVSRCVKAIEPNTSLLYHRNVKVLDLFLARTLLEILGASMSFIVLTLSLAFFDWMLLPQDVLTMIMAWFLLAWFAVSLGMIVGSLTDKSEMISRAWTTISYLMFPLSGAVFMVDWLPKAAQDVVLLFPMVHATEMLRHGYFGGVVRTYEDPAYLIVVNITLSMIGLLLVRRASNRVELV
ncbi:MAG: ABC transporter permease [Arenimonas sp.]